MKPKASRREEIVKAAVEINEIKKRKTIKNYISCVMIYTKMYK